MTNTPKSNNPNFEERAYQLNPNATFEEKLHDKLGAYHIEFNGVVPHEPFYGTGNPDNDLQPGERCDTELKNELVEAISNLVEEENKESIKKAFQDFVNKHSNKGLEEDDWFECEHEYIRNFIKELDE